jgi:uncharacterized membrane protein
MASAHPPDEPERPAAREQPVPDPEQPADDPTTPEALRGLSRRIDKLLDPGFRLLDHAEKRVLVPAWRRITKGEPRWPVSLAVLLAIALQAAVPRWLAFGPRWFVPALEASVLAGIVLANPMRIDTESRRLRAATVILIGVMTYANIWGAGHLVREMVLRDRTLTAQRLLLIGLAIWLTNVIAFALWYWELDRGGPASRSQGLRPHPDFLFPQMQSPDLAPPDWDAQFVDYLYLSFTNATAFSPTDVLPLARWAKLTMLLQSAVSLITVALVIARAVNILGS